MVNKLIKYAICQIHKKKIKTIAKNKYKNNIKGLFTTTIKHKSKICIKIHEKIKFTAKTTTKLFQLVADNLYKKRFNFPTKNCNL